jgi:hypothetical protein
VFSFLLGVLLAILALLSELTAIGWWTQWLMMSAFWWGAYTRRHHALGLAAGMLGDRTPAADRASRRSVARRVSDVLETRIGFAAARAAKRKLSRPAPEVEQQGQPRPSGGGRPAGERARTGVEDQARRLLVGERRDASSRVDGAAETDRRLSAGRARLRRLGRERSDALAAGDTRRAAELGHRGTRMAEEIDREQKALDAARAVAAESDRAANEPGSVRTHERLRERARFLDSQAGLPAGRATSSSPHRQRRDYAALAGLAGLGRAEYERLEPRRQREARLGIDRELSLRRDLGGTSGVLAGSPASVLSGQRREALDRGGEDSPATHARAKVRRDARHAAQLPTVEQSSVLRDAREVAARRKRQLGKDRP